jgi:hypothetical protein
MGIELNPTQPGRKPDFVRGESGQTDPNEDDRFPFLSEVLLIAPAGFPLAEWPRLLAVHGYERDVYKQVLPLRRISLNTGVPGQSFQF